MKTNKCSLITLLVALLLTIGSFAQTDSTRRVSVHPRAYIVPGSLIALGVYSRFEGVPLSKYAVRDFRHKHFSGFHTTADDYLQYAPIVAAYGLGVIPGAQSKSDFVNKTVILAKAELLMVATVYPLKYGIGDQRPDSDSRNAWPSGHTTQAFVAATFLHHEYKHVSPWISVAAFSCAGTVGAMRILNDRHWSADVLAGAGLGILVTHVAYMTHQYRWKNFGFLEKKDISLVPLFLGKEKLIAFRVGL